MRLSEQALAALPPGIACFAYPRANRGVGIVHFGLGAFHRAHQAWYTDRAIEAEGGDWLIAGVSMRSADVAAQLIPQDGLYTIVERGPSGAAMRVSGALRRALVAQRDRAEIVAALAAPSVHIASFTVTEKGYCRAADGSLDHALAEAGGFYPLLADGLELRRAASLGGVTLLSCDNMSDNGKQLRRLVADYLGRHRPPLLDWFLAHCTCPSSMVNRAVPATMAEDRAEVAAALGMCDEGVVVAEPSSQWVIEDSFAAARPAWDSVGVQFVADVAPYEYAKLRMLNGAHSALAYLGLPAGHQYVHEAVNDPGIRTLIERLMRCEASVTIDPAPKQDLSAYASELFDRFANPALRHRLIQIAMDGSQKLPQRWLETLAIRQQRGLESPALLTALAAWLRHLRGDNAACGPVEDPRAAELALAWKRVGAPGMVAALFGSDGLIASTWRPDRAECEFVEALLG